MARYSLAKAYETVARSLRDFGYSDASADMVKDTHAAIKAGKTEMPHGVIGVFAESQLRDVGDALDRLLVS